ncbi:iron dicitrate transport regulator FecR [Chitinophaga alhagiae]|uniref:Iron dicitrate transport regulator FecR n=1 Tax=Chitinophaga alhagiae TaxID=2203219 RepID=A0ABM6WB73_9BACT|nr:FecR domain-containing protein [Chitinophaga alhagiae]AWO01099.1 iron dicitrate transport regulator FecR [Chitinophaga alhagiae]
MTRPTRAQLNELADKWMKGTITPSEKELLDKWYDLDTEEPVTWAAGDASEEQLAARLLSNINTQKKPSYFSKRWQIPAAAVLLILLGVGTYLYVLRSDPREQVAVAGKEIRPGKDQAILTLGNGEKIILADAANGEVANRSGVKITKTTNGQLVYDATGSTNESLPLEYNSIEAPAGGQWQVRLPDGSVIFLNASSSITYPTRFVGNERKIQMTGEAYFEIAHNKEMPFRVESRGQTVEVLGTHFNVMAYADERIVQTTLLEGSVRIVTALGSKMLEPGEQAQLSGNKLKVSSDVDLEGVVAWKNGYFKFNEGLESIMAKIARWYDVDVEYRDKPAIGLTFSGKISRSRDISGILKMLEYTGDVHFKLEGRKVIVTK